MELRLPEILEAIRRESRFWPKILREEPKTSVPELLESAEDHVEEAIEAFKALAESVPRRQNDEVRAILGLLEEARQETRLARVVIEAIAGVLRPWKRKEKKERLMAG